MSDFFETTAFERQRRGAADQVIEDLRGRILAGEIERASKLPTERQLAGDCCTNG